MESLQFCSQSSQSDDDHWPTWIAIIWSPSHVFPRVRWSGAAVSLMPKTDDSIGSIMKGQRTWLQLSCVVVEFIFIMRSLEGFQSLVSQSLSRSHSHIALEAVFSKSKCESLCGCIVHIDSVHGPAGTYYLDASPVHKWSSPWQLRSEVSVEPWKQKVIIAGSCWSVMVRSLIFGPEARFWVFIFDQILVVIQFYDAIFIWIILYR